MTLGKEKLAPVFARTVVVGEEEEGLDEDRMEEEEAICHGECHPGRLNFFKAAGEWPSVALRRCEM